MADLTISNPQPFVVTVALDRGDGLETQNLAYNGTWTVPAATDRQIWIAFFLLESGELLAEAELPAGTASAQLLLEQPYDILLRADVNAPLTIANDLDIPIRVDVLPVGQAEVQSRDLDAACDAGSTWAMPAFEHGQWIGFYSEDDEYIGASLDGSTEIETITLKHPGAAYVIGDPFPAGTPIVTRSFVREREK
jgi:hypothetical protein